MSSPYHFSPRPPVAPHPTPSSTSQYSLPKPRAPRPPILNPYDKFTQPEFDDWISGITGALRNALGQEELKPLWRAENDGIRQQELNGHIETEESDDDPADDSFAEFKARRALGKGKARDPREGPGLRKRDTVRRIEIVSSDEEEEEEVQLAIASLDDEENDDKGEEEEEEEEEYLWETGQSSSQLLPLPGRRKKSEPEPGEEEYEDDVEYYEYEDYEEEDSGDQPRGSSPQVIEILSDDEDAEQSTPAKRLVGESSYDNLDEGQEGGDVGEDGEGYSTDEGEEGNEEIVPPRVPKPQEFLTSSTSGYVQSACEEDDEELDEMVDEIQGIQSAAYLSQSGRHPEEEDPRRKMQDTLRQSHMNAQGHYFGGESSNNRQTDADPLHLDTDDNKHFDNDEHGQTAALDKELQPGSQNISFSLENLLVERREVDMPDHWSGPRHYAQDYYSDGKITVPLHRKPDSNHLGPGDVDHIVLDAGGEELANEIEDEIQPIDADTSFPLHERMREDVGEIPDAWAGPQIYAEDYYSGGDVRTFPGERLDPFVLHGTGDADDGIDDFLTPGALSPNFSNERTSANEDSESLSNFSEQHATSTLEGNVSRPQAEHINMENSDDEPVTHWPTEVSLNITGIEEQSQQIQETGRLTKEVVDDIRSSTPEIGIDTSMYDSQTAAISENSFEILEPDMVTSGTISNSFINDEVPDSELGPATTNLLNIIPTAEAIQRIASLSSTDQISIVSESASPPKEQFAADNLTSSHEGRYTATKHNISSGELTSSVHHRIADSIMVGKSGQTGSVPAPEPHEAQPHAEESVVTAEKQLKDAHSVDDADGAMVLTPDTQHAGESQGIVIDAAQVEVSQVSEIIPITTISEPLEGKDDPNHRDAYNTMEVVVDRYFTEVPHDRSMSPEVISVAAEEIGDTEQNVPVLEPINYVTPEVVLPEAASVNDSKTGLGLSPDIPEQDQLQTSSPHISSVISDSHADEMPSAHDVTNPLSTEEVPLPSVDNSTSTTIVQTHNSVVPQISGDPRDFVLSSNNEAFFNSNLPNYFGDFLPALQKTSIQHDAVAPPTTAPAREGDGGDKTDQKSDATKTKNEDNYEVALATVPTTHVLAQNRSLPSIISDAYPYNLSTPSSSLPITSPTTYIRHDVEKGNLTTPTLTSQPPPPHASTRQTTKTRPKESEDVTAESLSGGAEWDDLEFQYPSEQSIIAEFKDVIPPVPISQPSQAESEKTSHESEATKPHLGFSNERPEVTSVKELSATEASAIEIGSSLAQEDVVDVAPPAISETAEGIIVVEAETSSSKAAESSKQSAKRKRDTSPSTPFPQIIHEAKLASNEKSKGRRAPKSDRKAKSNQQTTEISILASGDTIHVRPRPLDTSLQENSEKVVDVFGATPAYRILQPGSRTSPATPDPSDKFAGMQSSSMINKSSKPPNQNLTMPLTSLFHTHGKGRKQQLLSNLPSKMMKKVQSLRSSPTHTSPTPKSPELPAPLALPLSTPSSVSNEIAPLETLASTVSSTPPIAPSDTSPTLTPVTPVPTLSPSISHAIVFNRSPVPPIAEPPTVPTPAPSQPQQYTPSHHSKSARGASKTSSPVTRSHCRYHRISLPKEEGGPRVTFLVPGCSLNDKGLMKDEEIEDHGDATVEDSHRMIKDLESLNFHSDLIGILRQLVGLDILREQEVFYLPQPGEDVPRQHSLRKSVSEKSAMVRVPADSSSYAGSPVYSGGHPGSPGSFRAGTSISSSRSPSISGLRSFIGSEKGSSFAPTDTEQSDGEEPGSKRSKVMGPPALALAPSKKAKRSHKSKPKGDTEGSETGRSSKKSRKSTIVRGVKRSRTENLNEPQQEGEPSSKKMKAHSTDPGHSPEKHV